MDYIISEIRKCMLAGAWYAAITLALTLPAICAAAENPKDKNQRRGRDRVKYLTWVENTELPKKYDTNIGQQLYALRCSTLHEGSYWVGTEEMPRLIVVPPNSRLSLHRVRMISPLGSTIAHDAPTLCEDIIAEVEKWEANNRDNPTIQKSLSEVVHVYPDGLVPFVVGVPVIG